MWKKVCGEETNGEKKEEGYGKGRKIREGEGGSRPYMLIPIPYGFFCVCGCAIFWDRAKSFWFPHPSQNSVVVCTQKRAAFLRNYSIERREISVFFGVIF